MSVRVFNNKLKLIIAYFNRRGNIHMLLIRGKIC